MRIPLAAIGIVLALGTFVSAQGTGQEKIYSRQKAFRIPFQIPDPAEQKQLQEVQLYVARNGGKWEKYTSAPPDVPPEKRNFTFRTDQDGEYWFSVRTLDKKGVMNPAEDANMAVGLRVVVDSEVPRIDLKALSRSGREVGVEWEVQDRNITLDSLKMEYRVEGEESWQAVPGIVPKFVGQAVWTPEAPGRVTLRCQVQDRAQNLGIHSLELEPGTNTGRAFGNQTPDSFGSQGGFKTRDSGTNSSTGTGMKPFNKEADIPLGQPTGPSRSGQNSNRRTPNTNSSFEPMQTSEEVQGPTQQNQTKPTNQSNFGSRTAQAQSQKPSNRQVLNDSELSLDYQIEDEGPSGVSVIELWTTTDLGRTWKKFGEDSDRQSPFTVNLTGEGVYGLTLVARSGVGLGDRPPVAGDQPQMWVEIDKTSPQIELDTPEIGRGPQAGSVIITWRAGDENLGERCASLYYAEGKSDWKPIATGIENTGRYIWKMTNQTPYRFRIAIEITDTAGNREMAESPEVTIDLSKPKPKVIGITPKERNFR